MSRNKENNNKGAAQNVNETADKILGAKKVVKLFNAGAATMFVRSKGEDNVKFSPADILEFFEEEVKAIIHYEKVILAEKATSIADNGQVPALTARIAILEAENKALKDENENYKIQVENLVNSAVTDKEPPKEK